MENFFHLIILGSLLFLLSTTFFRNTFGDKTSAKELAIKANVPIIRGSDTAFSTPEEAKAWINEASNPITYPGENFLHGILKLLIKERIFLF